ncbi:ribonuclease HII [Psychroflexus montanilacus]|uniref:ribonuclease HII n=1 Tax=Psychroflexus montanilacus TaxID=2873598 RepID=UPI001CCE3FB7|nr:ribonuclease HII [Psychroflexus montanilacus]MBZ9651401.1 ribonuclease HII [Psychroflexus montanilacus]
MLQLNFQDKYLECGTDEAGRGCLAGPVTAAAVILPKDFHNTMLNDSKLLTSKKRELLEVILKEESLAFGISQVDMEIIDEINILNASILAMHQSIQQLSPQPELILVDGNKFKAYKKIQHQCIIKGDSKFLSIAAASILAKTARDAFMRKIDKEYPMYGWAQNKGYPTKAHRRAIQKYGITKYHRKSFKLLPEQMELKLKTN